MKLFPERRELIIFFLLILLSFPTLLATSLSPQASFNTTVPRLYGKPFPRNVSRGNTLLLPLLLFLFLLFSRTGITISAIKLRERYFCREFFFSSPFVLFYFSSFFFPFLSALSLFGDERGSISFLSAVTLLARERRDFFVIVFVERKKNIKLHSQRKKRPFESLSNSRHCFE